LKWSPVFSIDTMSNSEILTAVVEVGERLVVYSDFELVSMLHNRKRIAADVEGVVKCSLVARGGELIG